MTANKISKYLHFVRFQKRKFLLIVIDLLIASSLYYMSHYLYLLYENKPFPNVFQELAVSFTLFILLFLFRNIFGIYKSVWRYPNTFSFIRLITADIFTAISFFLLTRGLIELFYIKNGLAVLFTVCIITFATLTSRIFYQQHHSRKHYSEFSKKTKRNVLIVGAGQVGVMLANELIMNSKSKYNPYCFADTDKQKVGNKIAGLPVIAADNDIIEKIKELPIEEIIIAIPKLEGDEKKHLYDFYKQSGLPIKIFDFAFGQDDNANGARVIRDFKIEELLSRAPININDDVTLRYYKGKRILVTGGGGSIGSEICRQIARFEPARLIILDVYENNAYELEQELIRHYGKKPPLAVEIASVRDRDRLEHFDYYRPEIVFHAAAHKHVPLMEHSPGEAIKNNVFGTYNTADMAEKYGAEKFILISTDKAVNPTNVMGASKRICEMIVESRFDSRTSFAAVRFGNVLGSNGSVIPLFKKQIEDGGPITITDKRIIRYFMTIPEAAQLVLQAGIMAKRGELFVLDMGKPVKILDLAENMVRLSGLEPYRDIDIVEIGLRDGEKLYEELLIKNDNLSITLNKNIFIEKGTVLDRKQIDEKLEILESALETAKSPAKGDIIKQAVKKVVESYKDPEEINSAAKESEEMKVCFASTT